MIYKELKNRIEKKTGIEPKNQRLYFQNKELNKNNSYLSSYCITGRLFYKKRNIDFTLLKIIIFIIRKWVYYSFAYENSQ